MAAPVTLAELRQRAQKLADMENSSFVDDDEWNELLNSAISELYDTLVQCGQPEYSSADTTIQLVPGQRLYQLPGDFRNLSKVMFQENSSRQCTLYPLQEGEMDLARPVERSGQVNIEYVPAPPILEIDTDAHDFVSGWARMVTSMAARDALAKEESDTSVLQNYVDRMFLRIRTSGANRDRGQPKTIGRRNTETIGYRGWPGFLTQNNLIRYRLRGGNIEFYQL